MTFEILTALIPYLLAAIAVLLFLFTLIAGFRAREMVEDLPPLGLKDLLKALREIPEN